MTRGQALLAQGDAARASALGRILLAEYPGSPAVLVFAVDAEIARAGMLAGLVTYERWAEGNKTEYGPALHEVARAALHDEANKGGSWSIKIMVLQALASDGDADAANTLASAEVEAEVAPGLLASVGNEKAITVLIAELQSPAGDQKRAIMALGDSRSQRAIRPLIIMLSDRRFDVRAAAAEALGKLGGTQAITPLKALLDDPVFSVHFQAAAALLVLNDLSGLSWLRQLEGSPEPGIRLAAAQATRSQPDGAWIALVRELTKASDPEIRRQGAELLAAHDPQAAKAVLKSLLTHPNVAEQEAATRSYLRQAETDLPALRGYLRTGNEDARVQAAIRILELTR